MRADADFRRFYEAEFDPVLRAAWSLSGDPSVAEDATQEAFARALDRWSKLREHPNVGGWVAMTALNEVRKARRRRTEPLRADLPEPETESGVGLWAAVRRLPRRQREAVVLHYAMDLPLKEVAELMGCRNGTVKSHLARARQSLSRTVEAT